MLKGKPSERLGRKATGLSPLDKDMVAGLLGRCNNKCIRARLSLSEAGFLWPIIKDRSNSGTVANDEITSLLALKAKNNSKEAI